MSHQAGSLRIGCDRCATVIVLPLAATLNGWCVGSETKDAFIRSGWSGDIYSDSAHHCSECTKEEPLEVF